MKREESSLRTKQEFADSLKRAMQQRPFAKITVKQLCEENNFNRKTFYYHFQDMYALLRWMLEEEAVEVVRQYSNMDNYEDALNFLMDYTEENAIFISCACDAMGEKALQRFFCTSFQDIVVKFLHHAQEVNGVKLDPAYEEFLVLFYIQALTGILSDWIAGRDNRNRAVICEYLLQTVRSSLAGILAHVSGTSPAAIHF